MISARASNGYTLVEMLAALLVLGLAMTALTQATRLFSRTAQHAAAASSDAAKTAALERVLQRALGPGPYGSKMTGAEAGFEGDQHRILFDCDEPTACNLILQDRAGTTTLTRRAHGVGSASIESRALEFRYVVAGQSTPRYPASADDRALDAVAIVSPAGETLAIWRPQATQSADCAFDQVNHRCFPRQDSRPHE